VAFRSILVLGGVRSGKSSFAERLAAECGEPVLYVATATAGDDEMAERIAMHRAQRPATWRTLEAPVNVAAQLVAEIGDAQTVLVEDLTLLLSSLMTEDEISAELRATQEVNDLIALRAHIIFVTNEVGMGVVPPYPLGRLFRDSLGRVNQSAAAACSEVYFVVAGVPLRLK
jgi:adenosylcobinamide kinase/adenosylcobinamide-phosphate guanylyltransferase